MNNAGLTDNRSLLNKADLALSDLTGQGGLLVPAQASKFIRLLIKQSKLLPQVTVVPMRSPVQRINKARFNGRVLRAGQEATALPAASRAKPDLSQVEMSAKLFKGEVRLDNEVLEDTIEREELRQTIMQLMTEAVARDTEDVVVNGDTTSADTFLAQFDGVLKQATSHVVDAATSTLHKGILRDVIKAMPQEFRRDKSSLVYLTSGNAEIDYRDSLADRQTPGGDTWLDTEPEVRYIGIPVQGIPLFAETLGTGSVCTDVLLTDPKNINVGIWRSIRIETDRLVSDGVLVIVVSLRMDCKFTEELATTKAINVGLS